MSPLGPAGAYEIGYRVVSDDGHPVQGKVAFTLTTPGPGGGRTDRRPGRRRRPPRPRKPAPPATTAVDPQASSRPSEGAPIWPWLVGAVILVAVGAVVALRLGRRG